MENLVTFANKDFWKGKKVFVTGHTGFKGGWLSLWLQEMGAEVHGYALPPPTNPSFYEECKLHKNFASSTFADIRDLQIIKSAIKKVAPEIVFHLAAQPIVRESYEQPIKTLNTNVMGTANLLQALRQVQDSLKAVVIITSDKCYENTEQVWPYRETDPLGGFDPYSCSKACAEIVTASFKRSFLKDVPLATVRAGNVIGGGDWAADRIVPDILRAYDNDLPLVIRNPAALRPWQHVLEPLSGYLTLAEYLYQKVKDRNGDFSGAWNFGPNEESVRPVGDLVKLLKQFLPRDVNCEEPYNEEPHEAKILHLDSTKARRKLGWKPRWTLEETVEKIAEWHLEREEKSDMREMSLQQIYEYVSEIVD